MYVSENIIFANYIIFVNVLAILDHFQAIQKCVTTTVKGGGGTQTLVVRRIR